LLARLPQSIERSFLRLAFNLFLLNGLKRHSLEIHEPQYRHLQGNREAHFQERATSVKKKYRPSDASWLMASTTSILTTRSRSMLLLAFYRIKKMALVETPVLETGSNGPRKSGMLGGTLDGSKDRNQAITPVTQMPSALGRQSSERDLKADELSLTVRIKTSAIRNTVLVLKALKQKTIGAKSVIQHHTGGRKLMAILSTRQRKEAKTALNAFRDRCGILSLSSRVQVQQHVQQLESEIDCLKEQIEAKTCSAYNSNNHRAYESLTGDLTMVLADDSKVEGYDQDLIESSRNVKDELAVSYLHFVESQNAALTDQLNSQLEEIAELKRALDGAG
jgi:hypothetical protein